jgi:hypothetical protein
VFRILVLSAAFAVLSPSAEAKSRKVEVYESGRKVKTIRVYPRKSDVYVRGQKVRTYRERR